MIMLYFCVKSIPGNIFKAELNMFVLQMHSVQFCILNKLTFLLYIFVSAFSSETKSEGYINW